MPPPTHTHTVLCSHNEQWGLSDQNTIQFNCSSRRNFQNIFESFKFLLSGQNNVLTFDFWSLISTICHALDLYLAFHIEVSTHVQKCNTKFNMVVKYLKNTLSTSWTVLDMQGFCLTAAGCYWGLKIELLVKDEKVTPLAYMGDFMCSQQMLELVLGWNK